MNGGGVSTLDAVQPLILGAGALILVLAVVFWLVKHRFGGIGAAQIDCRLLGSLAVGAREKVVVIQVENCRLVLGVTSTNVNCLCELGEATEPSNPRLRSVVLPGPGSPGSGSSGPGSPGPGLQRQGLQGWARVLAEAIQRCCVR